MRICMNRLKINDTVTVIAGKDKGKSGQVIEILPKKGKVKVKGIALVAKHKKARKQGEVSGIRQIESLIDISNVMPVCRACKVPTRVGVKSVDDAKLRICRQCHEAF